MKILSVNAGSSSLKFKLYEMPEEKGLISGVFEKIGLRTYFLKPIFLYYINLVNSNSTLNKSPSICISNFPFCKFVKSLAIDNPKSASFCCS